MLPDAPIPRPLDARAVRVLVHRRARRLLHSAALQLADPVPAAPLGRVIRAQHAALRDRVDGGAPGEGSGHRQRDSGAVPPARRAAQHRRAAGLTRLPLGRRPRAVARRARELNGHVQRPAAAVQQHAAALR